MRIIPKVIVIAFTSAITFLIILYLAISFYFLDLNPDAWDSFHRALFSVFATTIISSVIFAIIVTLSSKNGGNDGSR